MLGRARGQPTTKVGTLPPPALTLMTALREARAVEQASRAEMDRRLIAFAATLPAADRARFGEALARPALGRRGPGGRGDRAALPER